MLQKWTLKKFSEFLYVCIYIHIHMNIYMYIHAHTHTIQAKSIRPLVVFILRNKKM
uniref:Uncharacterized protein n=1 Tax=Anguilla anguilla TaxID=7936 RepID=A0A0E9SQY3_ANGAN